MFELYPHQSKAIAELREGFRQGHKRQVLALATGGGKTVVAGHLALSAKAKGTRALFVVDRIELVGQAVRTFSALGLSVGVLRGEDTNYGESDDIVVASIQTIASRGAPDWVRLILIDECHILHRAHIRLMERWNAIPVIGLSATPLRKGLGKHFTNLVRGPSVRELTERGFLVPVTAFAPGAERIDALLGKVQAGTTTHGFDYNEADLGEAMNCQELVGDIVTTWKTRGENRPTLCFAVNIAHSKAIRDDFEAEGATAAHLDAYTDRDERQRLIDGFKAGAIKILTSVNVLGIGFDVPDASCLILARPTLSEALHMQQMGRGIRTAAGKKDCIVLDHAANALKHGLPIHFEVPDLDDGTESERGVRKAKEKPKFVACTECGGVMEPDVRSCPHCGWDRPRKTSNVRVLEGDLVAFGAAGQARPPAEGRAWFLGLKWHAESKGYAPGWAYHKYAEKFGAYPPNAWRGLEPEQPTTEMLRWIRSQAIRWAKRRSA